MDASTAGQFEVLSYGLLQQKVKQGRRAFSFAVHDLRWGVEGDPVWCEFGLTSGGIATSILREIVVEAKGETVHDC